MRVAVVFFPASKRDKMASVSHALARGVEKQGHSVDVIDGIRDGRSKLSVYQYVAVGAEQANLLGGRIPRQTHEFLAGAGMVVGKRSCAYILKHAIGERRTLSALMSAMEKEGMFLRISHSLKTDDEAEAVGAGLKIE